MRRILDRGSNFYFVVTIAKIFEISNLFEAFTFCYDINVGHLLLLMSLYSQQ